MKGTSFIILCLLMFLFPNVYSQQVYFPKKALSDTASLKKFIPVLANAIIEKLEAIPKTDRDGEFYGSLFAVQTIAQQYDKSLESIDSLRSFMTRSLHVLKEDSYGYLSIYDTYNHIKLLQKGGDKRSDIDILKWALPITLNSFNGQALVYAEEPFSHDNDEIEEEWQKKLSVVKARTNDSLFLDSAIMFSQAYLQYVVYKPFLAEAKKIVFDLDKANFIIQDSVMITMRDGVKLAAVIVRDRKFPDPQPVVMMSTIYASNDEVFSAKQITTHGYVGIILNIRGKYVSDVRIEPWEHDANDLYDAIDWISKQGWCNGKIGMYGGSYLGFTQWAATKKLHPALKTIVPQAATAPGIDFPRHNGIFTTYNYSWLSSVTHDKLNGLQFLFDSAAHWTSLYNKWYISGKAFNNIDTIDDKPNAIFQKWLKHPLFDKYWQSTIPYQHDFSKINIPVLTITGYYDGEQLGSLYYYKQHHQWNASANHYLVIGPYDHAGAGSGYIQPILGGYTLDDVANINIDSLIYQWFDYTLKGGKKPSLLQDTVNYEVMGANRWVHVPSLKKASSSFLDLYLTNTKQGKYYKLATQKTGGSVSQNVDLSVRKERNVSYSLNTSGVLTDSLSADDTIRFISDIQKGDFIIAGSFIANLSASVNKKDMDIAITLTVQQPDGKYLNLFGVFGRASYAKDHSKRNLLKPGVKENIPVSGPFTSVKVLKGSRLIVSISVIYGQYAEINYGTGADVATENIKSAKQPLQINWYGDSLIQIPINK